MHKNQLKQFLEGNANFEDIQETNSDSKHAGEFIQSYKKLIKESKSKVPDFDPFVKVNKFKQKRLLTRRKILLYAASVLIVVSLFFVTRNYYLKPTKVVVHQQELNEIKENTQIALLHFSKEFKNCMAQFEDAKKMQEPITEIQSLKNYNVEFDNPIKNFKINTP